MRKLLDILKSSQPRTLGLPTTTLLLLALLAAGYGTSCSDNTQNSLGQRVRVSLTRPTQPSQLTSLFGPVYYGHEFGLDFRKEDFLIFQSHAIATQSVLSNQTAILGGSLVAHLLIRERGQDFKIFCSQTNLDDFVAVGRNGVTTLEQFFDPNVRVGIDSAGGAGEIILNAMFQAAGIKKRLADIPHTRLIESSGLRTSVFVANDVDATVIHLTQFNQAAREIPDATIISALFEDVPIFLKEVFTARTSWLEENQELAAAFCASVIKASRELPKDFDLFVQGVNEFVGEPPNEDLLREIFDLLGQYDFWPVNGGLAPEVITMMAELAVDGGTLKEVPNPEVVVDRRPLERALELLGGRVDHNRKLEE